MSSWRALMLWLRKSPCLYTTQLDGSAKVFYEVQIPLQ